MDEEYTNRMLMGPCPPGNSIKVTDNGERAKAIAARFKGSDDPVGKAIYMFSRHITHDENGDPRQSVVSTVAPATVWPTYVQSSWLRTAGPTFDDHCAVFAIGWNTFAALMVDDTSPDEKLFRDNVDTTRAMALRVELVTQTSAPSLADTAVLLMLGQLLATSKQANHRCATRADTRAKLRELRGLEGAENDDPRQLAISGAVDEAWGRVQTLKRTEEDQPRPAA